MLETHDFILRKESRPVTVKEESQHVTILNFSFFPVKCLTRIKLNGYLLEELLEYSNQSDLMSIECQNDINSIKDAIEGRTIWALKILESSAVIPTDFIFGNNHWIGSIRECNEISNPVKMTLVIDEYIARNAFIYQKPVNMTLKYRQARMKINSPIQVKEFFRPNILHLGLCLPLTCNTIDIEFLLRSYLSANTSTLIDRYMIQVHDLEIKDLELNENYYKKSIVVLTFILIYISKYSTKIPRKHQFLIKFLKAYSLRSNFDHIFHAGSPKFPAINGLKLYSSFQILQSHTQYFAFYRFLAKWYTLIDAEDITYQIVTNGVVFVDVFFVISGFLLMNNYISNKTQYKVLHDGSPWFKLKFIISNLVKRVTRILPVYIIIMLLTDVIASYLRDTSMFQLHEKDDFNCQNYWWRNILFIQNFYPNYDMCLNWSWTLAVDMQCFVLCTVIYVFYCSNMNVGKTILWLVTGFFSATLFYRLYEHSYVPTLDKLFLTLDEIYYPTFARAIPYFIGALIAFLYANGCLAQISKKTAKYIWISTYIIIILTVWAPHYKSNHPLFWVPFLFISRIVRI
uniref:CSON009091 protein n=1 Tax=Culicoides sonorensis TaxID=179676 RepID=A0A336N8P2_CULSO